MTVRHCKADSECEARVVAYGYCDRHYRRWRKYGDPLYSEKFRSPQQRFLDTPKHADGECLIWDGPTTDLGYGRVYGVGAGKHVMAHRVSYELAHGEIPEGLVLDHLCRRPSCVNPDHLEPVTDRENILRGVGYAAQSSRVTHCPQGHPYDEVNTYRWRGWRLCRTCRSRVPA